MVNLDAINIKKCRFQLVKALYLLDLLILLINGKMVVKIESRF